MLKRLWLRVLLGMAIWGTLIGVAVLVGIVEV
jgi:hypothetical protein